LRKLCHLSFEDIGADLFGKDFTLCRHEIEVNCRESLIRLLSFGCLDRKGRVIYSFAAEAQMSGTREGAVPNKGK